MAPVALLAAACAAPAEDAGGLRRVGELPPAHRELWLAWLRDADDWPERRAAARSDPRLAAFLVDNLAREMLGAYGRGEIATRESDEHGLFERAQAELVILGPLSVPTLAELCAIGDAATAHLAGELLVEIGAPSIDYVAGLLERDEEQARRRAAELLGRLPHARSGEERVRSVLAARLAGDPDWLVRREAARALGRRGSMDVGTGEARRPLVAALGDADRAVREAAAEGLAQLEDPASIPALINYLERSEREADVGGVGTARRALRALSGGVERRDARAWREWWRSRPPAAKNASGAGNRPPPPPTIPRP